jgi:rare lipoprotein A
MTANGEAFDPNGLNAAHKYLPLPTFVRVTNLDNKRQIILRVNDRGPFIDGRIIDLSAGAAKKLGFFEKGTARVVVETVDIDG